MKGIVPLTAIVVTLVLLVAPAAGLAQPPTGVPTIGILRWIRDAQQEAALRDAFRERGWVERIVP